MIALTVFGAITAAAALVLTSLAMAQLLSRTAPDALKLRALGASRRQASLVAALPGVIPVAGIIVITATGALALSPLAPVGPVRFFAPGQGLYADPLVFGAGLPALFVLLSGLLGVLALRAVRPARQAAGAERSAVTRAAIAAGLPPAAVVGTRNALGGGTAGAARQASTLGGSIVAVAAMVAAVVFGASLTGLVSHPVRYAPTPARVRRAQGAGHDPPPGLGRRRLADHAHPADRGPRRRPAGSRRGSRGLARIR